MSSASLERRLAVANESEASFVPNETVRAEMKRRNVTLGSLIGVSGVGKSHLIPFITQHGGSRFSEIANISSRPPRPSDPADFRGSQPVAELLDRIEAGDVVNYAAHPAGTIYATDLESYKTETVLLPTLTSGLPQLQLSCCFKKVVPIGVAIDGETWENERVDERINQARLHEALTCVGWLRKNLAHIPIVENKTGQEEEAAQTIIDIIKDPTQPRPLENQERVDLLLLSLAAAATRKLCKSPLI